MKIQIFSDLHLEFGDYQPHIANDIDVVLFAGDIDVQQRSITWLEKVHKQCKNSPYFLYICGNHEFYGQVFPAVIRSLKYKIHNPKILLLENESVTIQEVQFICATLWTDFKLFNAPEMSKLAASQMMNDYRKIVYYQESKNQLRLLHPQDIEHYHTKSRHYIEQQLIDSAAKKVILMTHHAPSLESVPINKRDNLIYAAYANHLEELCKGKDGAVIPKVWVHGHIHQSQDYYINHTHVIANPRGYVGYKENPEFKDQYIIEV